MASLEQAVPNPGVHRDLLAPVLDLRSCVVCAAGLLSAPVPALKHIFNELRYEMARKVAEGLPDGRVEVSHVGLNDRVVDLTYPLQQDARVPLQPAMY